MKTLQAITEFIDDHPSYFNPSGVQFYISPGESIMIAADLLPPCKEDMIFLEFFREVATVEELVNLFDLSETKGLDQLQPDDLMHLYLQGKMSIVCTLDGYLPRNMSFRKEGDKLFAVNDSDQMHEVKSVLESPEKFIAYTIGYYELNSN